MEHAREHARQDLAQRIQAYSSAHQQAQRRKQRQVYNEAYERLEMAGMDLTMPEKIARRASYLAEVEKEVEKVLITDVARLVKKYI
jgi:hypothetical protein